MTGTARGSRFTSAAAHYLDERTKLAGAVRGLARKVFPDHWSFLLGEIALYCFVVLLITGTFLTFFFQASMEELAYAGPYVPLKGVEMSAALASTLDISFSVRGGLLIRQTHHWAALLMNAAIGLHLLRVFFTGAFRKPRELNWVIGFVLFVLAIAEGFTGYSLPDDTLSGNGLRIADGVAKSIPVVGTYTSFLLFGGEFPGTAIVGRLYALHILLIPAVMLALIAVHLVFVVLHKHTQYRVPGATGGNVVGYPLLPVYAAKAGGFFFIVFGVIVLIAAVVGINPVWAYGPYDPSPVSAGTQPDWYIGFVDGILRLVPSGWETEWLGLTWSWNMLVPVLVLLGFLGLVAAYPFLESWITGDQREHHVLVRPRNAPARTGLGVAGVIFYAVLWAAASSDLIATHFQLSIEGVLLALQLALVLGPIAGYAVTKRVCLGLQHRDRAELVHGRETGQVVRLPGGAYVERHAALSPDERWRRLPEPGGPQVIHVPRVGEHLAGRTRLRAALAHWFFSDRLVEPEVDPEAGPEVGPALDPEGGDAAHRGIP